MMNGVSGVKGNEKGKEKLCIIKKCAKRTREGKLTKCLDTG